MSGGQSSCPPLISYNIPTQTFCGQEFAFLWILLLVLAGGALSPGPSSNTGPSEGFLAQTDDL